MFCDAFENFEIIKDANIYEYSNIDVTKTRKINEENKNILKKLDISNFFEQSISRRDLFTFEPKLAVYHTVIGYRYFTQQSTTP